jgi:anti-sigma factor RsiW
MSFSCQQAREWIEQALDGTIIPREEKNLRRHLEGCPRCRELYALEKRSLEALQALPRAEPPADLPERVLQALPDMSPKTLGQLAKVLQSATTDAELRGRLQGNPQATLLSMHITLPPGMRVEVVPEQPAPLPTQEVLYLPLPTEPLLLQELEQRLAAMGIGALFGLWW